MIRIVLLTALVLLTSACNRNTYTWNQRMTVTVETLDGIISGSSVVEVTARYYNPGCGLAGDIEVNYSYRSEAVAVEVLPGQWLFALIGNLAGLMYTASPDQFGAIPRHDRGRWLAATPRQTEAVELADALRPRLVTFADITVPASVEAVDADNLAATFGEDVRLVEVTLEVTRDEASMSNIDTILLWRCDYLNPCRRLDGRSGPISGNSLAERLGPGNFSLAECS
ncbi:hypothetical protein A8B78_15905 [Jannaschia sp. EhC01]|nr:hypothetical protein A8B78_15905 [Jannaschia sp. EhC01]